MPDGSTANLDVAPAHSPVLVTGIGVIPGAAYSFSATGAVRNGGDPLVFAGPEGDAPIEKEFGSENGIAILNAPINSLIGVFLDSSQPNTSAAPSGLDFSTMASRDYFSLLPLLKQPFFIGDGLTSSNIVQQVIAPTGASRLYLGTMDGSGWYNNEGSFIVEVVPEPGSVVLLALFSSALMASVRSRRSTIVSTIMLT
jgi:hypothetical protein